ncbi:MAG: hypothetical protein HXX17_15960 [Geobacteraceae bacterium]|nr:hypothetical protein [Geobacteraceae bacterium]
MKAVKILLVALFALVVAVPLFAKEQVADADAVKTEAVKAFEQILDLWRAGDYGNLYDKTMVNGKDTKESFSKRMATARLKPSCCWEKMQNVVVSVKTPSTVVIKAKIGLDAPGEMEYKTKSFKLTNEFGEWRIARSELLSLAEVGKVKKTLKHKVKVVN